MQLADLPGNQLGIGNARQIVLDADAAGHGWFIDTTPLADEEFDATGRATTSAAAHRIDALTRDHARTRPHPRPWKITTTRKTTPQR